MFEVQVQIVFDFGLCDCICVLYDLVMVIECNIVEWLVILQWVVQLVYFDLLDVMFDGYVVMLFLMVCQMCVLVVLLLLVYVEFVLVELDYFYGVMQLLQNVLLVYDIYFFGYVDWFYFEEGQWLLGYLE